MTFTETLVSILRAYSDDISIGSDVEAINTIKQAVLEEIESLRLPETYIPKGQGYNIALDDLSARFGKVEK